MNKQTRKLLFYSLIMIFPALGIIAIFYSNGWRFDPSTLSINKLGAIFFEKLPPDAIINIDKNQYKFESGFLKSSLLIANLFPKTYIVKVEKNGYQSWTKELKIRPSLVTEVPPILLIPEKFELGNPVKKNIADFWTNKNYLIALSQNMILKSENEQISGNTVLTWSENGDFVISKAGDSYFLINLRNPSSALNVTAAFSDIYQTDFKIKPTAIQNIKFYSQNPSELIIQNKNGLYILNAEKLTVQKIYSGIVKAFSVKNKRIIAAVPDAVLSINAAAKTADKIVSVSLPDIRAVEISPSGNHLAMLNEKDNLFLFNESSGELELIAENALAMTFSPDNNKIAFTTKNKEVVIYPLNEIKNKKISVLNIGLPEKGEIIWHQNSEYLFIKYPPYSSGLYLLSANDLPPINLQLIDSENDKFQYLPEEETVYLLKNGYLYKIYLNK